MTEVPHPADTRRANIVADIVGHPHGAPSVEELEYTNPDLDEDQIRLHLQKLEGKGIVRGLDADYDADHVSVAQPPDRFYKLSEEAKARYKKSGEFPEDAWTRQHSSVEKTERIQNLEDLPRPD